MEQSDLPLGRHHRRNLRRASRIRIVIDVVDRSESCCSSLLNNSQTAAGSLQYQNDRQYGPTWQNRIQRPLRQKVFLLNHVSTAQGGGSSRQKTTELI